MTNKKTNLKYISSDVLDVDNKHELRHKEFIKTATKCKLLSQTANFINYLACKMLTVQLEFIQ